MSQDRIREILATYGELMEGNVWKVQGQTVILHKALERIAAKAMIVFDPPVVLRAERDEAVLLVTGRTYRRTEKEGIFDKVEWSIGEALVNVNYRVSGRQAAYVYAMAEKRAKDRVILKLIELHGYAYSEDEADDFRSGKPRLTEPEAESDEPPDWAPIQVSSGTGENRKSAYQARKDGRWTLLVESLRACPNVASLIHWSDYHAEELAELPAGWVAELREEWKARAAEIKAQAEA